LGDVTQGLSAFCSHVDGEHRSAMVDAAQSRSVFRHLRGACQEGYPILAFPPGVSPRLNEAIEKAHMGDQTMFVRLLAEVQFE
jgi:hypothetical protein